VACAENCDGRRREGSAKGKQRAEWALCRRCSAEASEHAPHDAQLLFSMARTGVRTLDRSLTGSLIPFSPLSLPVFGGGFFLGRGWGTSCTVGSGGCPVFF